MTPQEKPRKGSRRDLRLHTSCPTHAESERPLPTLPPLTKFLLSEEVTKTAKMERAVTRNRSLRTRRRGCQRAVALGWRVAGLFAQPGLRLQLRSPPRGRPPFPRFRRPPSEVSLRSTTSKPLGPFHALIYKAHPKAHPFSMTRFVINRFVLLIARESFAGELVTRP